MKKEFDFKNLKKFAIVYIDENDVLQFDAGGFSAHELIGVAEIIRVTNLSRIVENVKTNEPKK